MTEYGRGPGPEPWHPEDPLNGDGGWGGQQTQAGQQAPYGGLPQHHPQQSQQPQYDGWHQQQSEYDQYGRQQYPHYGEQGHQQYAQQGDEHYNGHQQHPTGHDQQHYAGHGQQHYAGHGQQHYAGHGQQQYTGHDQQQYPAQSQPQYPQGGWDATGTHGHVPYAADPGDPYGQQPVAYGAEQPDLYGTPDAYPPPRPPGRRRPEPEPETDWDPGPDQGEHAFFAGGGDDDADDDLDHDPAARRGRGDRRGKGAKGGKGAKKRRNGCACMVVVLVFGGGLGGVGYFGLKFYQNRFGAAPDYAGNGTNETVTVEIPKGAGGYEIGRRLKDAGVVKSVDAFVSAQTQNPEGGTIQAGAYVLKKEMSGASAVKLMLDPTSQSNVLVKPGERNAQVYQAIDKQLGLASGTTQKTAQKEYKKLGMPSWAQNNSRIRDPLEGFLFPGTYPAAKGMKPDTVLKQMVTQAKQKYAGYGLEAKAKELDLADPFQLVTVASLVQAEGKTHDDFRKMAEVIYNRLKPTNTETNRLLQFDSTYNYLKGQSNIHISESEIHSNKDPYNTYTNAGLPPGPIGNPSDDALKATLNPTHDGWIYFVATDGESNTEFAKTFDEFQKLKDKFNANNGR
ncbi:endolytic transglycosylase MltG [Streptomyces sp. NPDC001508]|uniref:endolytic transglycosylase MltG n=1 Tax=Streptomyces sp. NPDC001508 TaxID=3154656 RepID=UPI00331E0BAE